MQLEEWNYWQPIQNAVGFGHYRELLQPTKFVKLSLKQQKNAGFVCPYCKLGTLDKPTEYLLKKSKIHHLAECECKPARQISLKRYWGDWIKFKGKSIRESRKKTSATISRLACERAEGRGHVPIFFNCKFPAITTKARKTHLYGCVTCGATCSQDSAGQPWVSTCKGKWTKFGGRAVQWWSNIGKLNGLRNVIRQLRVPGDEQKELLIAVQKHRKSDMQN